MTERDLLSSDTYSSDSYSNDVGSSDSYSHLAGTLADPAAEVEAPLLACVLEHTDGNQTRAADALGLNRGTLRKKLKLYGLIEGDAP